MTTLNLIKDFKPELSELFNKVCYKNRSSFNNLVKQLTINNKNIGLLLSNPASRNTHYSNLFLNYCKVQLVKELINDRINIDEIVIDSESIKKVLIQIPGLSGTKIIIKKKASCLINNKVLLLIYALKEYISCSIQLIIFMMHSI